MIRRLAVPTSLDNAPDSMFLFRLDISASIPADLTVSASLANAVFSISSAALKISGVNKSVSKLETLPCSTAATRSSPMPVSIEGLGNGVSL